MAQTRRDLAAEIRDFRLARRWTQGELARRLGVTSATVSRWESGLSVPKPEHLRKIASLNRAWMARGFLDRYLKLRERERIDASVQRAQGILETHRIGAHTITLMEDGSIRVNGVLRVEAPSP